MAVADDRPLLRECVAVDLAGIRRLRDAGVAGIILGEALLSGRIEYPAAQEAAA